MWNARTAPVLALLAGLAGCGVAPRQPEPSFATVSGVYVEAAPGLFVERGLAGQRSGPLVAEVRPRGLGGAERGDALVWADSAVGVEAGDEVRIRLARPASGMAGARIPAGNRLLERVSGAEVAFAVAGAGD